MSCRRIQRRKNEGAVKSGLRKTGVANRSQTSSKLENVIAMNQRRVILQFVVVLVIDNRALAIAAGGERSQDVHARESCPRATGCRAREDTGSASHSRFRAEDLGVADLKRVFVGLRVVGLRRKVELPDAVIVLTIAEILVARGQRVVLADLVIEPRTEVGAGTRIRNRVGKGNGVGYRWSDPE